MANKENENLTVFGSETEFDGVLEFTDSVVITGKFHGTINASGNLEIEKNAICNVDNMKAQSVVISGQVTGNVEGKERIELCSGSKVKGDLTSARLRIADNVEFDGKVSMIDEIPSTDIFAVGSQEFKNSLVMRTNEAN
ncbi:MAG: polymer-forming cytoskeletal protein [Treponema sp.]|nr:polymer-forming cytoskeletal protein [Spirochaetia bacterium]MDD7580797.1 polymer-forming cytoskeletal protein [Treponema sp.]MCI7441475.1 polymer-forming cytoskeletal protein [Spirochaetia bacterium]MDY3758547.1 polymer-forming cytoskeletal protein [Treponema sp.]MDY4130569.1 polymer-forming cytoskeletal protein [Treponema sp.]